MMSTFWVRIDVTALRTNMSREEKRDLSEAEVLAWLKDAGFVAEGDGWTVREADLGQLDPSEVVEAKQINE